MSDLEDAKIDHAYACGMQAALAMAAQGAQEKAREIAERRLAEALPIIRANR